MLELRDLRITLPGFTLTADLTVARGTRTALLGPSGAGKSTLLAAIAGFQPLSSGRILIDGHDVTDLAPGKRGIAIVFQDQNLFPHLTAAQNVGLALDPMLRLSDDDRGRVSRALAHTGLTGFGDRRPSQLSGGQQARVTLARVLLQRHPLILLDEPFSALGPALRAEMLSLVETLAAETGATLLMVTHDPADARRLCPQTIVVADGRAAPPAPTVAILSDPPPGLAAYLGA